MSKIFNEPVLDSEESDDELLPAWPKGGVLGPGHPLPPSKDLESVPVENAQIVKGRVVSPIDLFENPRAPVEPTGIPLVKSEPIENAKIEGVQIVRGPAVSSIELLEDTPTVSKSTQLQLIESESTESAPAEGPQIDWNPRDTVSIKGEGAPAKDRQIICNAVNPLLIKSESTQRAPADGSDIILEHIETQSIQSESTEDAPAQGLQLAYEPGLSSSVTRKLAEELPTLGRSAETVSVKSESIDRPLSRGESIEGDLIKRISVKTDLTEPGLVESEPVERQPSRRGPVDSDATETPPIYSEPRKQTPITRPFLKSESVEIISIKSVAREKADEDSKSLKRKLLRSSADTEDLDYGCGPRKKVKLEGSPPVESAKEELDAEGGEVEPQIKEEDSDSQLGDQFGTQVFGRYRTPSEDLLGTQIDGDRLKLYSEDQLEVDSESRDMKSESRGSLLEPQSESRRNMQTKSQTDIKMEYETQERPESVYKDEGETKDDSQYESQIKIEHEVQSEIATDLKNESQEESEDDIKEENPEDAEKSPFIIHRASLYLPVSPVYQHFALDGVCAEHLSSLILSFYAPFKGVIMCYEKPQLSDTPEDPDSHLQRSIVARACDEYAASYLWVTANFLVFAPRRGHALRGWVTFQNESMIGLVCWNYFNARISRDRLPQNWNWVSTQTGQVKKETDDHARSKSKHGNGHYVDEDGQKIEGFLNFNVADIEVTTDFYREKELLRIDGTLLTAA